MKEKIYKDKVIDSLTEKEELAKAVLSNVPEMLIKIANERTEMIDRYNEEQPDIYEEFNKIRLSLSVVLSPEDVEKLRKFIGDSELYAWRQAKQSERERIRGMVEKLKKPLWDDDPNRYLENISRHNTLDEVLNLLSERE